MAIEELSQAVDALSGDNQALRAKCLGLETQINGLRKERDRLLEVSQGLRITISRSEKAANAVFSKPEHMRSMDAREQPTITEKSPAKPSPQTVPTPPTPQDENRKEMSALFDEVNQMREFMANLKKGKIFNEM